MLQGFGRGDPSQIRGDKNYLWRPISMIIAFVMGLPVLDSAARLHFSSREALVRDWDASVGCGFLVVKPELELSPLQVLEVVIEGLATPLRLQAEVLQFEPGARAMLRLVDGAVVQPPLSPLGRSEPPTAALPLATSVPEPAVAAQQVAATADLQANVRTPLRFDFGERPATLAKTLPIPPDATPSPSSPPAAAHPVHNAPTLTPTATTTTTTAVANPFARAPTLTPSATTTTLTPAVANPFARAPTLTPTTLPPTTLTPTTLTPTTLPPTTLPPTTLPPTTLTPTTLPPIVANPFARAPTLTPTALTPTTPTTLTPTTLTPTTLTPTTLTPTTLTPAVANPFARAPTLAPTTQPPTSLPPTTLPPTTLPPTTLTPAVANPFARAPSLAPTTLTPAVANPFARAPSLAPTTPAAAHPFVRTPALLLTPTTPPPPPDDGGTAASAMPSTPTSPTPAADGGALALAPSEGSQDTVAEVEATPADPPVLHADSLNFHTLSDLRGARHALESVGAVLAMREGDTTLGPCQLRLSVAGRRIASNIACTVSAEETGTAVVIFDDQESLVLLLAFLDAPDVPDVPDVPDAPDVPEQSASPDWQTSATEVREGPIPLVMPFSGKLWNPSTAAEILRLPLHRPVTEADIQRPSVPVLLRWLRTTRGVFKIEISKGGQPLPTLISVEGREVRSSTKVAHFGRALGAAEYDYVITKLPRAPSLSKSGRTLHLIVEAVRALLSNILTADIAAVFPAAKNPNYVRADPNLVDLLGFEGAHARLIKTGLQGTETIEKITEGTTAARVAWDVLVVLQLFDGLSWEPASARSPSPVATTGVSAAAAAAAAAAAVTPTAAFLAKDLFSVLGLHWSSSPLDIPAAYKATLAAYKPEGPKRPQNNIDAAAILARIEEAFNVLKETESRRSYRSATFNMVWSNQAEIIVERAKLAFFRRDTAAARLLLSAAQDLATSQAAEDLLAELTPKP